MTHLYATNCRNCGKPVKKPKRKFCCYTCATEYYTKKYEEKRTKMGKVIRKKARRG